MAHKVKAMTASLFVYIVLCNPKKGLLVTVPTHVYWYCGIMSLKWFRILKMHASV